MNRIERLLKAKVEETTWEIRVFEVVLRSD